jgi:hypothetical protein
MPRRLRAAIALASIHIRSPHQATSTWLEMPRHDLRHCPLPVAALRLEAGLTQGATREFIYAKPPVKTWWITAKGRSALDDLRTDFSRCHESVDLILRSTFGTAGSQLR